MKYVTFKSNDLKKIVKHSMENERRYPYTQNKAKEHGLWLVKDEGIYLMPSTDVKLRDDKREGHLLVVYARGYKPTESNKDTLWDKTYAFSRDDFAEFIPLKPKAIKNILDYDNPSIKIGLSDTQIEISVSA